MASTSRVASMCAVLTVLTFVPSAWAQEAVDISESSADPVLIEEVRPTPRGEWEVRSTAEYWRHGDGIGAAPRLQIFRGLTGRVSAELAVPLMYRLEPARAYGVGNVGLGMKMRLNAEGGAAVWVAGVEVAASSRTPEVGEPAGELSPSLGLVLQGRRMAAHSRVAWSQGLGQQAERTLVIQTALVVPVAASLALTGELQRRRVFDAESGTSLVAAPGVRATVASEVSLGCAVPVRVVDHRVQWGLTAQLQMGWR